MKKQLISIMLTLIIVFGLGVTVYISRGDGSINYPRSIPPYIGHSYARGGDGPIFP